jgi:hypothetical protein
MDHSTLSKVSKSTVIDNGFKIVYDSDLDQPIGDGFYFTISYPDMTGAELMHMLLYYGISAISLSNTGSTLEGLRACVSHVKRDQFDDLKVRLQQFHLDFPLKY